jgi:hypothetical protein
MVCSDVGRDWRLGPGSPCIGAGEDGTNIGALGVGCLLAVGDSSAMPRPLLTLVPNPLEGRGEVQLVLDDDRVVDLTIFDVQGRAVGRLFSGSLEPGAHAFPFDPVGEHLARGVYFVTLDWGGGREVARLVVGE